MAPGMVVIELEEEVEVDGIVFGQVWMVLVGVVVG